MLAFFEDDLDPISSVTSSNNNNNNTFIISSTMDQQQHPSSSSSNNSQQQPLQQPPQLFTMEQLQLMQQLHAKQQQQQSNQPVQQQQPSNQPVQQQPSNNVGQSNNNNNNNNGSPYMVLTQLPLQATPFANNNNNNHNSDNSSSNHHHGGNNNNNNNNNGGGLALTQQAMQQWAQLLQPTPIGDGVFLRNSGGDPNNNTGIGGAADQSGSSTPHSDASLSILQQFLSQSQAASNNNNFAVGGSGAGNLAAAPAGTAPSLPPQQTLPTRMEPVNPRGCHNSGSDWFANTMAQTTTADGKRKFALTNSTSSFGPADPLNADADLLDWATPTPLEEMGGPSSGKLHLQVQQQQQQPTNVASMPQQQPQQINSSMFDMSDQLRNLFQMQLQQQQEQNQQQQQQQLQQNQQQQQQQVVAQRKNNGTPADDDMSTSTANSSIKRSEPPPAQPHSALSLPSTVMPPTVMTSVLPETGKKPAIRRRQGAKSSRVESPQDVLERMLSLRGYAPPGDVRSIRIKAEDSNYDMTPSPLQLASFGTELVRAIHHSDVEKLGDLLRTGLSPNPCNQFRDSIVDLVCKKANAPIFQCLVEHGCDLRICDGFGRTPMHHCCWAANFCPEIASTILQTDPQQLLMEDKRGQTPLEYVRAEQAADWIEFLEDHANRFFPTGGSLAKPVSMKEKRNKEGHLPDPPRALPPHLATAVSSGKLTPQQLAQMDPAARAQFQ